MIQIVNLLGFASFLSFAFAETKIFPCQYWVEYEWYNLRSLQQLTEEQYFVATASDNSYTIEYSFCEKLQNTLSANCHEDLYAAQYDPTTDTCVPFSTNEESSIIQTTITYTDSLGTTSNNLALKYTSTESDSDCPDGKTYTVGLICDKSISGSNVQTSTTISTDSTCQLSTQLIAAEACPLYELSAVWQFLDDTYLYWAGVMIAIGFQMSIFGRYFIRFTLFVISFICLGFTIVLSVYAIFFNSETKSWVTWVLILGSLIISLILSIVVMKSQKFGIAFVTGWGGFFFGLILNSTCLYLLLSKIVFWSVLCSFYAIAFIMALLPKTYNYSYIISTALTGSYLLNKGIGLYAGGFPNEFMLIYNIQNDIQDKQVLTYYWYLIGIYVWFSFSMVVQCISYKRMEEYDKYLYDRLVHTIN